ncbi:hypothetical protein LXL04_034534 [Taraxacum kok-saghyz]
MILGMHNVKTMSVMRPSKKETESCSKAVVPHTKYQGAYVTQEFEQVEDFGTTTTIHFEMPNIDDEFHYDDYSLYAAFDAEYNNTDVLAGVGVEDSSVESGFVSAPKTGAKSIENQLHL